MQPIPGHPKPFVDDLETASGCIGARKKRGDRELTFGRSVETGRGVDLEPLFPETAKGAFHAYGIGDQDDPAQMARPELFAALNRVLEGRPRIALRQDVRAVDPEFFEEVTHDFGTGGTGRSRIHLPSADQDWKSSALLIDFGSVETAIEGIITQFGV